METQNVTFGVGETEKEIEFSMPQVPQKDANGKYLFEVCDLVGDVVLGDGSSRFYEANVNFDIKWPIVSFSEFELTARQSDGAVSIPVLRSLTSNFIKVNWRENGERHFANEWKKHAGTLEFAPLVGIQTIQLPVCDKPTSSKATEIELQLAGKKNSFVGFFFKLSKSHQW
jgi:hypothetical protein